MAADLQAQLAQMQGRLQRLEDERAIQELIVDYGLAVDCGDTERAIALFTEDGCYAVAAPGAGRNDVNRHTAESLLMEGRAAIAEMLDGAGHQSLLPGCAHTVGPVRVCWPQEKGTADAEPNVTAEVTGYSRLYVQEGDGVRLLRLGINHWLLHKQAGRWLIKRRTSTLLGSDAAQQLLRECGNRAV